MSEPKTPWPHAPTHQLATSGTFFVTSSTYLKGRHFRGVNRRDHTPARQVWFNFRESRLTYPKSYFA